MQLSKKVLSEKNQTITEVTKWNIDKCLAHELYRCVNHRKNWYDYNHREDALFYLVNDSRILACPTLYGCNFVVKLDLKTKNRRW